MNFGGLALSHPPEKTTELAVVDVAVTGAWQGPFVRWAT
jgi:hypothetical protein